MPGGGELPMLLPIGGRSSAVIKLGEMIMILDLHRQGLSVSAIARESGFDRKTVRRYIERGLEPPRYGPRKPRPRLLDPYTAYLRDRSSAERRVGQEWVRTCRCPRSPSPQKKNNNS